MASVEETKPMNPNSLPKKVQTNRKVNQINIGKHELIQKCCQIVESSLDKYLDVDLHTGPIKNLDGNEIKEPLFVSKMRECHDVLTQEKSINSINQDTRIDWESMPPSLTPQGGGLKGNRAINKMQQVQALMDKIIPLVDYLHDLKRKKGKSNDGTTDDRIHIVDIGAGSGHIGLVIAWMRPDICRVTLLERKEYGSQQAQRRIDEANITNVQVANTSLHAFCDYEFDPHGDLSTEGTFGPAAVKFDLAISLHSCGVLTDAALEMSAYNRAAFCFCPCCYGQTSSNDFLRPHIPRSKALYEIREQEMPEEWDKLKRGRNKVKLFKGNEVPTPFTLVARSADCASPVDGKESFVTSRNFRLAKRCMQIADADRLCWLSEYGYSGAISSLLPLEITPKNNIIIGIPKEKIDDSFTCDIDNMEISTLALQASAIENFESEEGEKDSEREKIREAHKKWKEQFQQSLGLVGDV